MIELPDEGVCIRQGTPRPIANLLFLYLVERNAAAAETVLRRVDEKFNRLSDLPFIGRERSSLAPGIRSVVVGTLVIFYTVGQDSITIVRVIDGRMDIDEEFRR